CMQGLDLPFTF
nr:immunoglobulin light chain junction region [Macaca mulatta]